MLISVKYGFNHINNINVEKKNIKDDIKLNVGKHHDDIKSPIL